MAEGAVKERWNHTADVMSLIANCHRNSEEWPSPFTRCDFHPFLESLPTKNDCDNCDISVLKVLLPS